MIGNEASGWALCPWFEEHGTDMVHPEDVPIIRNVCPYGKVFRVEGQADGFTLRSYGTARFRIKPHLLIAVDEAKYAVGEIGTRAGIGEFQVTGVYWHHRDARPYYTISVEGRRKSKRYRADDL